MRVLQKIIIKKASEFGEAEVWMNERLARAAPSSCATFLTAYPDGPPRVGTPLALVWKFEGQTSLNDAMQARDFPTNVENEVMGRELRIQDPVARKVACVKVCPATSGSCATRAILPSARQLHMQSASHCPACPLLSHATTYAITRTKAHHTRAPNQQASLHPCIDYTSRATHFAIRTRSVHT